MRRGGDLIVTVRQPVGRYLAIVHARGAHVRWRVLRATRPSPGTRALLEISAPIRHRRAQVRVTILPVALTVHRCFFIRQEAARYR